MSQFWNLTIGELLEHLYTETRSGSFEPLLLRGHMGFGKSTILEWLLEHDYHVIDGDQLSILMDVLDQYQVSEVRDVSLTALGQGKTPYFTWDDPKRNEIRRSGHLYSVAKRWLGDDYTFDAVSQNWAYNDGRPVLVLPDYEDYRVNLKRRNQSMIDAGLAPHEILSRVAFRRYVVDTLSEGAEVIYNPMGGVQDDLDKIILGFISRKE